MCNIDIRNRRYSLCQGSFENMNICILIVRSLFIFLILIALTSHFINASLNEKDILLVHKIETIKKQEQTQIFRINQIFQLHLTYQKPNFTIKINYSVFPFSLLGITIKETNLIKRLPTAFP